MLIGGVIGIPFGAWYIGAAIGFIVAKIASVFDCVCNIARARNMPVPTDPYGAAGMETLSTLIAVDCAADGADILAGKLGLPHGVVVALIAETVLDVVTTAWENQILNEVLEQDPGAGIWPCEDWEECKKALGIGRPRGGGGR